MPPPNPITVVLARFDDLLAAGLHALLESDPSLAIVASGVEAGRISVVIRAHRPPVAILDVSSLTKLSDVRELSSRHPATRLVLLADAPSSAECAQLLAFGASACLDRNTQSRDVLNAIHLASRGLQLMPRARSQGGALIARDGLLTRRETDVLALLQLGRSNAEIALGLGVGIETVRTHASNLYRKLGVSSRRELAAAQLPERLRGGLDAPHASPRRADPLRPRARQGHGLRRR